MDLILLQPGDASVASQSNLTLLQGAWPISKGASPINGPNPTNPYFELTSLHQGMKQQITTDVSNMARTSGRPIITEFTCVKYVDAASVMLYDRCLRALPLGSGPDKPSTIYILRNSGEQLLNIMTFQLRDAIISEIQLQTHPEDMPTEQFKINFTEILWNYTVQANDTTTPGSIPGGWSIRQNRAITAFV